MRACTRALCTLGALKHQSEYTYRHFVRLLFGWRWPFIHSAISYLFRWVHVWLTGSSVEYVHWSCETFVTIRISLSSDSLATSHNHNIHCYSTEHRIWLEKSCPKCFGYAAGDYSFDCCRKNFIHSVRRAHTNTNPKRTDSCIMSLTFLYGFDFIFIDCVHWNLNRIIEIND